MTEELKKCHFLQSASDAEGFQPKYKSIEELDVCSDTGPHSEQIVIPDDPKDGPQRVCLVKQAALEEFAAHPSETIPEEFIPFSRTSNIQSNDQFINAQASTNNFKDYGKICRSEKSKPGMGYELFIEKDKDEKEKNWILENVCKTKLQLNTLRRIDLTDNEIISLVKILEAWENDFCIDVGANGSKALALKNDYSVEDIEGFYTERILKSEAFSPERAKEIVSALKRAFEKELNTNKRIMDAEDRAERADKRAKRAEETADRNFKWMMGMQALLIILLAKQMGIKLPGGESALKKFGKDLTELARRPGGLDPVIGRDREINLLDINLSADKKANAILVGPPGVGKSAIIEKLAQFIIGLEELGLENVGQKLKKLAAEADSLPAEQLNGRLLEITAEIAKKLGETNPFAERLRDLAQNRRQTEPSEFNRMIEQLGSKLEAKILSYESTTLVELDVNRLIAGTKWRGDFEARVTDVIDGVLYKGASFGRRAFIKVSNKVLKLLRLYEKFETKLAQWEEGAKTEKIGFFRRAILRVFKIDGRVILFIDEIDKAMQAGGSTEGGTSLADILKPILARRGVSLTGATLWDRYRKYIEPTDLARRLRDPIDVQEPSATETLEILKKLKGSLEKSTGAQIEDSAIQRAIELSQYRPGNNPDKSYSFLEEVCRDKTNDLSSLDNIVTEQDVEKFYQGRYAKLHKDIIDAAANPEKVMSQEDRYRLLGESVESILRNAIQNWDDLNQEKKADLVRKIVKTWVDAPTEFKGMYVTSKTPPHTVPENFVHEVIKAIDDPEIQKISSRQARSGRGPNGSKGGGGTPPPGPAGGGGGTSGAGFSGAGEAGRAAKGAAPEGGEVNRTRLVEEKVPRARGVLEHVGGAAPLFGLFATVATLRHNGRMSENEEGLFNSTIFGIFAFLDPVGLIAGGPLAKVGHRGGSELAKKTNLQSYLPEWLPAEEIAGIGGGFAGFTASIKIFSKFAWYRKISEAGRLGNRFAVELVKSHEARHFWAQSVKSDVAAAGSAVATAAQNARAGLSMAAQTARQVTAAGATIARQAAPVLRQTLQQIRNVTANAAPGALMMTPAVAAIAVSSAAVATVVVAGAIAAGGGGAAYLTYRSGVGEWLGDKLYAWIH